MHVIHTLAPFYDENSEILILGSMPSVESRKQNFYYAHPQNQFWRLLADVYEEEILDKQQFLIKHHIALFDVIQSCDIDGSKDSSIRNVIINDIASLVKNTKITKIFITGKKAYDLYQKYLKDVVGIDAIYLPSSSPLYQAMKYKDKLAIYRKIRTFDE